MASPNPLKFTRRFNEDGTIDSICRQCFTTIATAQLEADLDKAERQHSCEPWLLEKFHQPKT